MVRTLFLLCLAGQLIGAVCGCTSDSGTADAPTATSPIDEGKSKLTPQEAAQLEALDKIVIRLLKHADYQGDVAADPRKINDIMGTAMGSAHASLAKELHVEIGELTDADLHSVSFLTYYCRELAERDIDILYIDYDVFPDEPMTLADVTAELGQPAFTHSGELRRFKMLVPGVVEPCDPVAVQWRHYKYVEFGIGGDDSVIALRVVPKEFLVALDAKRTGATEETEGNRATSNSVPRIPSNQPVAKSGPTSTAEIYVSKSVPKGPGTAVAIIDSFEAKLLVAHAIPTNARWKLPGPLSAPKYPAEGFVTFTLTKSEWDAIKAARSISIQPNPEQEWTAFLPPNSRIQADFPGQLKSVEWRGMRSYGCVHKGVVMDITIFEDSEETRPLRDRLEFQAQLINAKNVEYRDVSLGEYKGIEMSYEFENESGENETSVDRTFEIGDVRYVVSCTTGSGTDLREIAPRFFESVKLVK